MGETNSFDKLYDIINWQSTSYITIISIMVAIIALIIAIFAFFQWKFSDKQLENLKNEVKEELREKYFLDDLNHRITDLEKEVSNIENKLENDAIDNMTNLTVMIFEKLDLFIAVKNPLGKNSVMHDVTNNLESLKLLKIKNSLKILNFNSIRKEMEKHIADDKVNESDKESIESMIQIVDAMIIELKTKDKYNLANNDE